MKKLLVFVLCIALVNPAFASDFRDIKPFVEKSYLELLNSASTLRVTQEEAAVARVFYEKQMKATEARIERDIKAVKREIKALQAELKRHNAASSEDNPEQAAKRVQLQCAIQSAQKRAVDLQLERFDARVLYDNQLAKLDLLLYWPTDAVRIAARKEAGTARQRKHGDVEDIGLRAGFEGQEKDVSLGSNYLAEMKRMGVFPPEVLDDAEKRFLRERAFYQHQLEAGADEYQLSRARFRLMVAQKDLVLATAISEYVQLLGQRIAAASDLKVPLKLYFVWADDPNAFALPGGYIVINTGLLYGQYGLGHVRREFGAGSESEFVGVLAHELGHVTARHGHRLIKRANLMNLIVNTAVMAVLVATGGIGSIGTYYLFQYGLLGLGLLLTLDILGVSRDFEREADQLGMQYAWKAGYDPLGFTRLHDRMSSQFGYARGTSWFRTHPAFYERIHDTFAEYSFLPRQESPIVDTEDFKTAVVLLKALRESRQAWLSEEGKNAPTLGEPRVDCP